MNFLLQTSTKFLSQAIETTSDSRAEQHQKIIAVWKERCGEWASCLKIQHATENNYLAELTLDF